MGVGRARGCGEVVGAGRARDCGEVVGVGKVRGCGEVVGVGRARGCGEVVGAGRARGCGEVVGARRRGGWISDSSVQVVHCLCHVVDLPPARQSLGQCWTGKEQAKVGVGMASGN